MMAEAKKCDRCGALYEEVPMGEMQSVVHSFARILFPDELFSQLTHINSAVDLCGECEDSFKEWWKAGKQNANKED